MMMIMNFVVVCLSSSIGKHVRESVEKYFKILRVQWHNWGAEGGSSPQGQKWRSNNYSRFNEFFGGSRGVRGR